MLTVRHWYGTFMDGHPPCNDCRADFPGFYAAAKLIWEKPSALYDNAPQLAIQKAIDNRIGDSILPFAYPPVTALVLMPLGWLSFRMAFVAITLVNMALLLFTLRLLIRKLGLQKRQSTWLLLSTFCNFGVHSVLLQGQTSLVVLFCLTAFMFSAMSGKQFHAGFWAGLNFLKPQLLPVPFIALTFQRLWQALSIAAEALQQGDVSAAAQLYGQILQEDPGNPKAVAGLARCYLQSGDIDRAKKTLQLVRPDGASDESIRAVEAELALKDNAAAAGDLAVLQAKVEADPADLQARFDLALGLDAKGARENAIDQLLEIVRRDRKWNEDAARKQLVILFDAMGPTDPRTISARRRLSSLLFS